MNREKLITLALVAMIASFGTVAAQNETVVDGVAAVVGKNIIKHSDIERPFAQMRLRSGMADAEANRCAILENLVINQLLVHKGEVDSVEVTDDEVNTYVEYYLSNDIAQYGSREALREATGFTYDELKTQYERMLRSMIMAQRVQYDITGSVKVTPREVNEFFAAIPADSLPEIGERYEFSVVEMAPAVSEEERDRVRNQLAELRERVVKGEKFSMLATLYSQDPGSAKKGGEVGFFGRGKMVPEFEAAAFALKPGEVSPIIESQYGFHILQLVERRGNTVNCRHILLIPQVSTADMLAARMRLDSIAVEIRAGNITFEDAARQYSTAANARQGGAAVAPDGSLKFDRAAVDEAYYSVGIPGLDEGQVSNATAIKNADGKDAYCIVRLNHKYPAHRANLTDDYDAIYNAALADAKQNKLRQWARQQMAKTYVRLDDQYKDCVFQNLK